VRRHDHADAIVHLDVAQRAEEGVAMAGQHHVAELTGAGGAANETDGARQRSFIGTFFDDGPHAQPRNLDAPVRGRIDSGCKALLLDLRSRRFHTFDTLDGGRFDGFRGTDRFSSSDCHRFDRNGGPPFEGPLLLRLIVPAQPRLPEDKAEQRDTRNAEGDLDQAKQPRGAFHR
jgi:hypothetical protein